MEPLRPRLVLLRHGETAWSVERRHTGRSDIPLTDVGREQAEAAAPALAGRPFALVLTSPLQRARQTAALAGFAAAEVDDDLAEWDYGEAEGRTTVELRREHAGWTVFDGPLPGGETPEQVGARADAVIERCAGIDGEVLLVAHGHLLRVLAARWIGCPATDARRWTLATASISELGWEREQRVVDHWNLTGHLAGVPAG